jgi:predicted nucleotide-binding protein (sugar kinase/HSP70/actin superfamily)
MPNLELVQLTSFGCGLDAVTSDQVEEIMRSRNRMYTLIKIDEGSNLGAIRIRMRSLIAAIKEREKKQQDLQKLITAADNQAETRKSEKKLTKKKLQHQIRPRIDPNVSI